MLSEIGSNTGLKWIFPYESSDASFFPIRNLNTSKLIEDLYKSQLVILHGDSGSGKTSFIQAQLIPALQLNGARVTLVRSIYNPHQEIFSDLYKRPVNKITEEFIGLDLEQVLNDNIYKSDQDWVLILDPGENLMHTISPQVNKIFWEDIYRTIQKHRENIHILFCIRSDFLADFKQFISFLPLFIDPPIYHLTHLHTEEIKLFFQIFSKLTNIHFTAGLEKHLLDSARQLRLRTVDIQIVVCYIYKQVNPTSPRAARTTYIEINLDNFLQWGNVPGIVRQFINNEVEKIFESIKKSRQYLAYLTQSPTLGLPIYRLDALLRRCIRLVFLCFLTTNDMLVISSYRAIIYQILKDESGIPKKLITITTLALTRHGFIRRSRENPNFLEIPNSSLASSIQNWIDSSIDIHSIINTLYQFRLIYSECIAFQRLLTKNELDEISTNANKIGFSTPELTLLFQSTLANAYLTQQWYVRMKDEFISITEIVDREKIKPAYKGRVNLVIGLYKIGKAMVPILFSFLQDESPQVRAHAIAALEGLETSGDWRKYLIFEAHIPKGAFLMGTDRGNFADEGPQHPYYLDSFYISLSPVTYIEYKKYMDDIEEPFDVTPGRERHPITNLTWFQIQEYTRWASLRLPEEPEWEKAASWNPVLESKTLYPWGNQFDETRCNMRAAKLNTTTPITRYSPRDDSFYGCTDLAGNVWEWTNSIFLPYPYSKNDGREEKSRSGSRVIRGGSYECGATYVTCTVRLAFDPYSKRSDLGFRTVLDIPNIQMW